MTQNFQPVNQIHQHVCGFHFYSGDLARQVEAHHYCSHLNDEMRQCVIYDSDGSGARLIGVEYIISERLFKTLSEDEKKYWHSHAYEVTSGTLTTPMTDLLPSAAATAAEKLEMSQLVNTYGKTFHLWQVDRGDQLPLGPPQLMMSFTKDGQLRRDLLQDRDTRYGIDSGTKRAERANLVPNAKVAGADGWETSGVAVQLEPRQVKMRMG
ncbi:DUF1264-domain-containing protein [Powellomyces hirtus]|nr:DUF1264-domain-containing protein [Powellomyces hirtus]